jgi:hypothetical protein
MPRWNKGSEVIERLLEARQLQRVPADAATVEGLIESARRHVATGRTATTNDPEGSFVLAYDAARKAASALLAHQGLRATTTGGHIVIVEAMNAQFPGVAGLKSIDRLRRRRNQAEYPDPANYDPVTTEESEDALIVATDCVEAASRLIAAPQLGVF